MRKQRRKKCQNQKEAKKCVSIKEKGCQNQKEGKNLELAGQGQKK